jgi:integrase
VLIAGLQARWQKLSHNTRFNNAFTLKKLCRVIDRQTGSQLEEVVQVPKRPTPRQRIATEAELAALFAAADPPLRMFLALTSIMALRFTEAEAIGWANWNPERQTLTTKTKGGKYREFKVPNEVANLIAVTPQGEGSFISLLNGRQIGHDQLRRRWTRLKRKAGVGDDLHPHDLRRTAAVRIFRLTKDVFAAKQLLGHDSLQSTAWYLTPHEPAALAEAANALKQWTPDPKRETPKPISRSTFDRIENPNYTGQRKTPVQ